jgi:hypothetical protein
MDQTATQTMLADTKALAGTRVDVAPLLGTWINATRNTDHVTTVVVTERDGAVRVRLHGTCDWGETTAVPYAFTGTSEVAGFHARYELGTNRIEIAANVKLGILVIQTYTSFQDDRLSQFSREFFYRSDARPPEGPTNSGRTFLRGDWVNTNPDTKWLRGITLTDTGKGFTLRVKAASDPTDWGEVAATTYLDSAGEPAFHARYDLGSLEAVLAGNTGKCIIIIEAFVRLKADESANTFCREFFVPR